MAKDVRFIIAANVERAEAEIRKLQSTGKAVSDSLATSFEQLGVRSTLAIEKERAASVAAYDRIKASGVASAQEIARAKTALTEKTSALDKELKGVRSSTDSLSGSFSTLKTMAASAIASFSVTQLVQARIEMDKVKNSLSAISGANAGSDFNFMRGEVARLGLSLQSTSKDFAMMNAASKGTSLEGEQMRKVFSAVTGASTVLGLSADDTSGILRAMNQMISKGTVQAEELKGQLGERLPGAFAMAARAMGLTTAELQKHLEAGTVLASDLLPKLAAEMNKTYGAQTAAAAKSTQAELNRLNTAFFELKAKAADGETFAGFFRAATGATKILGDNLDVVKVGLIAMTGSSVISGLTALAAKIATVGTVTATAQAGLFGLAAAGGYAIGKGIDKVVYKTTGYDITGDNEYEAGKKEYEASQKRLAAVSEKLRAQEVAENTKKEQAAQAKKESEALMAKELEAYKNHLEAKTALSKEQKALELAQMKGAFDRGETTTAQYYAREKEIAITAARERFENAKAYLEKESALLANIQARSKDGKKTPEYADELAKHEKAMGDVKTAQLALQTVIVDGSNKEAAAIRTVNEAYLKQHQAALESLGQYEASEQLKHELDMRSIETLRMKADAMAGVAAAAQAMADKELAASMAIIAGRQKDAATLRGYADSYFAIQNKIAATNGADSGFLSAKSALHDEINKKLELENKLELAIQSGNLAEYSYLQKMIAAETIHIGQLTTEVDLKRRVANLSAQNNADQIIVNDLIAKGLTDEAFWLQKKIDLRNLEAKIQQDQIRFDREIAQAIADGNTGLVESLRLARAITDEQNRAAGYAINDRRQSSSSAAAAGSSSDPFGLNGLFSTVPGVPWSSAVKYSAGTNYVPSDGYAYLHRGEAVVPERANRGGVVSQPGPAPITINGGITITLPNVTNQSTARELAREVWPELQKIQQRQRRA
jgi:tape measure domain-containing protein